MKNNNVWLGTLLGVTAAVLGFLSLLIDTSALGLVAGICGLGSAFFIVKFDNEQTATNRLERENTALESATAQQIQARLDAESKLKELEQKTQAESDRRSVSRTPPAAPATALYETETGLFSEEYFGVAVTMRIAAARRHLRPVALALIDVVEGGRSENPTSTDPALVAETIKATLREADTACRMNDGRFAIMLEDTPESGAVWTVERLRRAIAEHNSDLTLWAGVACYPAHAFDADEVTMRASNALVAARDWHQDRIEVATVD